MLSCAWSAATSPSSCSAAASAATTASAGERFEGEEEGDGNVAADSSLMGSDEGISVFAGGANAEDEEAVGSGFLVNQAGFGGTRGLFFDSTLSGAVVAIEMAESLGKLVIFCVASSSNGLELAMVLCTSIVKKQVLSRGGLVFEKA